MFEDFDHPELKKIRGQSNGNAVLFRGIKYALLKDRFAEPELILEYQYGEGDYMDATRAGPQALSSSTACDEEYEILGHTLPHDTFHVSDRDCLHLNITIPKHRATALPVFVFLHGGGFAVGSNSWPQYDLSRLVNLSVDLGMPFIGVAVNYRLGVPGFLTSSTLREAGYKANNGIRDQRVALRWVQNFISGFGGDPSRVTLGGQSAGAVSAMLHLDSGPLDPQPSSLFSQILLMSGSTLVLPPMPLPAAEDTYENIIKALGFDGLPCEEQIQGLLRIEGQELCQKVPPRLPLFPVADEDIVFAAPQYGELVERAEGHNPRESKLEKPSVPRIVSGSCLFDGYIFGMTLQNRENVSANFLEYTTRSFASYPMFAAGLAQIYGIHEGLPDQMAIKRISKWITDLGFLIPAEIMARSWPGRSFMYRFNESNPWIKGPCEGEPTHATDVVLLFQNYAEFLTPEQKQTGRQWATSVITFVNGLEPFPSSESNTTPITTFGPPIASGGTAEKGESSLAALLGRGTTQSCMVELCENANVGLDDLARAMHGFLFGS